MNDPKAKPSYTGVEPQFTTPIQVGTPNISANWKCLQLIEKALHSKILSNNGPLVQTLENRLADMHQVRHCICVSNGTTGLQIAAKALDIRGGVLMPAWTFIATPHALQWMGLEPVFCDIELEDHQLDLTDARTQLDKEINAIVSVHLWGKTSRAASIQHFAEKNKLTLLCDAAHAVGCSYQQKSVGNFGEIEVLSLHATKAIGAGEGGAILTNDKSLAKACRQLQNFGKNDSGEFAGLGINAKMSEISAAVALAAIDNANEIFDINHAHYNIYRNRLNNLAGFQILEFEEGESTNHQYLVLNVDQRSGLTRDEWLKYLHSENVIARNYFSPGCHKTPPYNETKKRELENTDILSRTTLCLPTGLSVSSQEVDKICDIIEARVEQANNRQHSRT